MNDFGSRLREERLKLGITQEKFAELGGVKKLTQITYEQGKRYPDVRYLMAVGESGVDVCYLLTGNLNPDIATRLDPNTLLPVSTAILEWMTSTNREVTPELLSDVISILYNSTIKEFDEDFMATQLRALK